MPLTYEHKQLDNYADHDTDTVRCTWTPPFNRESTRIGVYGGDSIDSENLRVGRY